MALRAVIDSNIWISSLLNPSGSPAAIISAFVDGRFEAVVSEPLLEEIAIVLARPKISDKYGITGNDIEDFLSLIEERSEHIIISGSVELCRDKDDDLIIETSVTGKATHLVTGDKDIAAVKKVVIFLSEKGVSVISSLDFLELI